MESPKNTATKCRRTSYLSEFYACLIRNPFSGSSFNHTPLILRDAHTCQRGYWQYMVAVFHLPLQALVNTLPMIKLHEAFSKPIDSEARGKKGSINVRAPYGATAGCKFYNCEVFVFSAAKPSTWHKQKLDFFSCDKTSCLFCCLFFFFHQSTNKKKKKNRQKK